MSSSDENLLLLTSKQSPVRRLLILAVAFTLGLACCRLFRFTFPILNYLFGFGVLILPFFALRAISQFRTVSKVLGYVVLTPLLLVDVLLILVALACDPPRIHRDGTNSCDRDIAIVKQGAYSVLLRVDCSGGATEAGTMLVEQRLQLLPGLYLRRVLDSFYGAYQGSLTPLGPNEVRLRLPGGESDKNVDKTYELKPHVYF